MSNASAHSSLASEPSDRKVLFSAIGWIGVIFLFALIVLIAYVPNRDETPATAYDEERLAIREEVDSTQRQKISEYAWENQAEGVVRVPVERAKQIVLLELRNAQGQPSDN